MKNLKKTLITLILISLLGSVNAKKVNINTVQQVAKNTFAQKIAPKLILNAQTYNDIKKLIPGVIEGDTVLYIANFENSFVIISADDITTPILGYCLENKFNQDSIPPALEFLINCSKKEIKELRKLKIKSTEETKSKWSSLTDSARLKSATSVIIEPLCSTIWGQTNGFNGDCPNNCPAGCVAVAMAQVLLKWGCLVKGTGSHSYNSDYRLESANFATANYKWVNMDNGYADDDNRQLIYHCGVAVDMDYGSDGSEASVKDDVIPALETYFGFKPTADFKDKTVHPFNWRDLLKIELNHGRPIIYRGEDDFGHAWVVDGYDSDDLFHCNWGWSNSNGCNTYYELGYLYPDVTVYADGDLYHFGNQGAIFGIEPIKTEGVKTPNLSNQIFTYSPNGYTLSVPPAEGATSYQWITNKGTITGTGNSATLNTYSTAAVQVRAYNNQCNIYSPYSSATITINYGPISAPDLICYSGSTISIQNVPSATITWGGTNVVYPNGNTGTSVFVRAATSSTSATGTITASFTIDGTPYTISKTVWAGKPNTPTEIIPFWNNGMEFGNDSYYEFRVIPQPGAISYIWVVNGGVITEGQGTNWITVKTNKITGDNNINFSVSVRAEGCAASSYFVRTGWVIPGTGGATLLFTPNPAIGETTLIIETTSPEESIDQDVEWDIEDYSPAQNLKEKQTNLKGKSTKIQTTGWQEGVYIVRVKYKDEILTGKLVVKK